MIKCKRCGVNTNTRPCPNCGAIYPGFSFKRLALFFLLAIVVYYIFLAFKYNETLSPLHEAAKAGDIQTIDRLIAEGADVNQTTELKRLPLHFAIKGGHLDAAIALIKAGSSIEQEDWLGYKPLHLAAKEGYMDIVNTLLSNGADINAKTINELGQTALHIASENCNTILVEYLIDHGATLNSTDNLSGTPLHRAAAKGCMDVVKYLMAQGLDPYATEHNGYTAIKLADIFSHDDVKLLLEVGAVGKLPDNDEFRTYTSPDGYSLLIPVNWDITDDPALTDLKRSAPEELKDKVTAKISRIFYDTSSGDGNNIVIGYDHSIPINNNELKQYIHNIKILSKYEKLDNIDINGQIIRHDGMDIFSIKLDSIQDGLRIRQWQLIIPARDKAFSFAFSSPVENYKKHAPYFNKMYESIKVTQQLN